MSTVSFKLNRLCATLFYTLSQMKISDPPLIHVSARLRNKYVLCNFFGMKHLWIELLKN